jgi:hypothetical protein
MNPLVLTIDSKGNGHCLYTEQIDLRQLGQLQIVRAAQIEFNHQTFEWEVKDPENQLLFHHASRSTCLAWEQQHFNQ